MIRKVLLIILASYSFNKGFSQGVLIPGSEDYYHLIDRYKILGGQLPDGLHTSFKGYNRQDIVQLIDSLEEQNGSNSDNFNFSWLKQDSWEFGDTVLLSPKPLLKYFYRTRSDLYHVKNENFDVHVNPVIYFDGGKESESGETLFINTRGMEVRGLIDGKVGFYTFMSENQMTMPYYLRQYRARTKTVPGEGFHKGFKDVGVDFFTVRGYITFPVTKHIGVQFGQDRFRVGNGFRSLILSDFSPSYPFLKVQTKIWKIQYTNLFTQFTEDLVPSSIAKGYGDYPQKYMAFHHLSVNITKKLNMGLFESIMFGSLDSTRTGYEVKYLNPIIFYRAVEQQDGSSDNAMLGMDWEYLPFKGVSVYGQFILDEFLLNHIRSGDGWWGNKFGFQGGLKYYNVAGIKNLDLQVEGNLVRPFTYSHGTRYGNYSHYRQPLAHPLGANFKEVSAILRYQPIPKLTFTAKVIMAQYGRDSIDQNWGGNIFLDNKTKEREFGNKIGQGMATTMSFVSLRASYQLYHNLFADLKFIMRKEESEYDIYDFDTKQVNFSMRWNIPYRNNDF